MPRAIESNLIVRTKVLEPTGGGFKTIVKELREIDRLLAKIERNVNVNINLTPQAQKVVNTLQNAASGRGAGGAGAGGTGGGGAGSRAGGTGGAGGGATPRRGSIERIQNIVEGELKKIEDRFEAVRGGKLLKRSN